MTCVEVVETGGAGQRELNVDPSGRFLFSCNTGSNDVTVLAIDSATGKLTRTAKTTVQRPMVIDFAVLLSREQIQVIRLQGRSISA